MQVLAFGRSVKPVPAELVSISKVTLNKFFDSLFKTSGVSACNTLKRRPKVKMCNKVIAAALVVPVVSMDRNAVISDWKGRTC